MTSLTEHLPDWREWSSGWKGRPATDVIPLLRSVLDEESASH
ncbi:MAG: hypothetical protein WB239_04440 [Acidimicrobiia bacterium]